MKKIFLPFMAIGIFVSSCSKKDKTEIENVKVEEISQQRIVNGFDFDQFGISHNAYLSFVAQNSAQNATRETRYNTGQNYNDPVFGSFRSGITWQNFEPTVQFSKDIALDILDNSFNAQTLANSNHISQNMVGHLNNLAGIFQSALTNEWNPQEFKNEIEKLEDNIVGNQQINFDQTTFVGNDGAALLAICAIAKYSYQYWYEYFPDDYPDPLMQRGLFGKIWHAIKVAAVDAYGFVVDGWYDSDGNGTKESWNSGHAVEGASKRSDTVD